MRALYSPQIYRIFSIRFSSRVRTKQKQHGPYFVPVYDQDNTFFWGGRRGGEKNAPYLYPALYQTVTCSWNVDERIRKRYRDCYVMRTFNNG